MKEGIEIKGIDVSHYQSGLNLALAKNGDYQFVILKLSEGRTVNDGCFDKFYAEAEANGIPVGAYVYSHATNTSVAVEEAVHAITLLNGRKLPLGLYIDVEAQEQLQLSNEQLKDVVMAFVKTVTNAGYRAGVYGSEYNAWGKLATEDFKDYTIWVAHYGKTPVIYCDLWQKTDKGSFPGWYNQVDVDEVMSDKFRKVVDDAMKSKDPIAKTFPPDPSIMILQMVLQYNGYWDNGITGYKSKEFFEKYFEFGKDMKNA